MIFVTVGTEKFPFDRLLKIMDEGIETGEIHQPLFGQTGHSQYAPKLFEHVRFLSLEKMKEFIQKSKIVVTHGGVGSVVLCLNLGKIPLIFPREKGLGEHVDDHQMEFTKMMEKEGRVLVAHSKEDLFYMIKNFDRLTKGFAIQHLPIKKAALVYFLSGFIEDIKKRKRGL